jgi:uncharacterized protein DUF3565
MFTGAGPHPDPGRMTDRRIVGFRQDAEQEWIAELECGHTQHVRHNPPWQVRSWVVTSEGRAGRLGTLLPCRLCDDTASIGTKPKQE